MDGSESCYWMESDEGAPTEGAPTEGAPTEGAPTEAALARNSWLCQRPTISVRTRAQSGLCSTFCLASPLETAVHWATEFFPKNNEEQWFGVGGASDSLGKKMRHKFRPYGPIVLKSPRSPVW